MSGVVILPSLIKDVIVVNFVMVHGNEFMEVSKEIHAKISGVVIFYSV
jgi:hypothetical protein